MNADDLIQELSLEPHPEGGWYRQTYSSERAVDTTSGVRPASTAIYFLLRDPDFSALHRIGSDELWHFYAGSPLRVDCISSNGAIESFVLGSDLAADGVFQAWVRAGDWFGASLVRGGWALVGCTVAPGFDFADFTMGDREVLLGMFPQHAALVCRLTRT